MSLDVRVAESPLRCPFCHDAVARLRVLVLQDGHGNHAGKLAMLRGDRLT